MSIGTALSGAASSSAEHRGSAGMAPENASPTRVEVRIVALEARDRDRDWQLLDDWERAFAARLRVGAAEWVASRAALRAALGSYLGLDPWRVRLESGANGKPRLAPGAGPDLRFNLSHSGGLALIAVRLGFEVGIDLEAIRPGVDGAAIARDQCDEAACRDLAAIADGAPDAFFRSWVRREALAKASGRGLATAIPREDAARFTVRDLDGIPGFAAAIASEGAGWTVSWPGAGPGPS